MNRAQPVRALLVYASAFNVAAFATRCDSPERRPGDAPVEQSAETSVTPVETLAHEASSPTESGCDEEVLRPTLLEGGQVMLPARYQRGEYILSVCVFRATVTVDGTLDGIHVIRPETIPDDLERSMREALESSRYEPATLCGEAVPYEMTVTFGHCPIESAERTRP
jgi:hypothetical protein